MNSLVIFHNVQLKNYNNVISSLQKACDQTSHMVDYMENYRNSSINNINKKYKRDNINNNKKKNQSVIGRIGSNIVTNNNPTKFKKKISENYKNGKTNKYNKYKNLKYKIFGNNIINNNYEDKINEPYNYNKEYENNLINDIENLFHPSAQTNNYKVKNKKEIMPNNYMEIYSLMENEFHLVEKKIEQYYKINTKKI